MVFKRRTPKSWALWALHLVWPQGGWARAFYYVKHRVRRLPDNPRRISRGIFAGVVTTFTPFYGLHFVVAAVLALIFRGNVLAAVMATFFGNPLTYLPIGVASLQTGYFLLGMEAQREVHLAERFGDAGHDLWHNVMAIFTSEAAHWGGLRAFYDEVFFPYMIGGIIPGMIAGIICYYLSVPLIAAYQNRRRGRLKAKWAELKAKKALKKAEDSTPGE